MGQSDRGRVLVISDGGVGALVACVIAREAAFAAPTKESRKSTPEPEDCRPLVWSPPAPSLSATARLKAVKRQCYLLDLEFVEPAPTDAHPDETTAGERATRDLINAAYAAMHRGVQRVVWPVHFDVKGEPDLPALSDAVDRALLVSRLVALDAGIDLRVECPLADLTDRQIADLVIDMDVPVKTCWWWHAQLAKYEQPGAETLPPGLDEFRSEYHRWTTALREVGWAYEPAGTS
jgi:hypothetical protein